MNLARTEVGVRPVVAWIEAVPPPSQAEGARGGGGSSGGQDAAADTQPPLLAEDVLIPRLDAKEVAAVFTAPFEAFLSCSAGDDDTVAGPGPASAPSSLSSYLSGPAMSTPSSDDDATAWYAGQWIPWHGGQWRMHNFYVPSASQRVAWAEPPATTMTMNRFRVFGMTARILVDAARVAFGREPEFEHNAHFGDEDMIGALVRQGVLGEVPRRTYGDDAAEPDGDGDAKAADAGSKM